MNSWGGLTDLLQSAWVDGKDLLKLSDRDLNQYRRARWGSSGSMGPGT